MALPVTLDSGNIEYNSSMSGPFRSSTGNIYVIVRTGVGSWEIEAHKATDPTDSFTEQDAANKPQMAGASNSTVQAIWTEQQGDLLFVGTQSVTDFGFFAQFNMATDLWVEVDTGDRDIEAHFVESAQQSNSCSLGLEKNGSDIILALAGPPGDNKDMGTAYDWIGYVRSTDGGVNWDSTLNNIADTGDQTVTDFTGPVIVVGLDDRMHFVFVDETNENMIQRTMDNTGTLQTFPSEFDTEAHADQDLSGRGVLLDGVIHVPYYADDGNSLVRVVSFISVDAPDPANFIIEDVSGSNVNSSGCFLALDGDVFYVVYTDLVTDDVFINVNSGSGWGTPENVHAGANPINFISANVYERDGPKVGFLYNDGLTGPVLYMEEPIDHIFGLLSDVNMGKVNSFHGPYET